MTMWQSGGMGGHGSQNNPWMKLMGIVHKERRHADNVQSQSGSNERNLNQMPALTIRAGTTHADSGGVVVDVAEIIRHPQWLYYNYDIALLRLSMALTFSGSIRAISLTKAEPPIGAKVTISGWGRLWQDGPSPTQLQYNTLKRISKHKCLRLNGFVPQTITCLAHTAGNGACYGDSGGPAVYKEKLIGVANYVIKQCGSGYADGYASVRYLRKWLIQNSDVK